MYYTKRQIQQAKKYLSGEAKMTEIKKEFGMNQFESHKLVCSVFKTYRGAVSKEEENNSLYKIRMAEAEMKRQWNFTKAEIDSQQY